MIRTLRWQLYVSFYTFCLGVPLLLFPNAVLPVFGFAPTSEPWVRVIGMFALGFTYVSTVIYRKRLVPLLLHSIVIRAGFTLVFAALAASGHPPFLYIAAIVAIGVFGSGWAYWSERSRPRAA